MQMGSRGLKPTGSGLLSPPCIRSRARALPGRRPLQTRYTAVSRYQAWSRCHSRRKVCSLARPLRCGLIDSSRQSCSGPGLKAESALGQSKAFLAGGALSSLRPAVIVSRRRNGCFIVSATLVDESTLQKSQVGGVPEIPNERLQEHPELVRGKLSNGFEYVILPNSTPPQRFEAHLEMHAGSVDEREDQQGIAHIVEHVTFLGSKKRDQLLGTGARSNAYTDFHHTVFHVHSPLTNTNNRDNTPMLPQVLDMLADVAFRPEFLLTRIEKERRAVLAEAQMMNTIEYRVDCCLLKYLHAENALSCRFPIGKTEQVEQWDRAALVEFWQKWYFPANATLYVVGELDRSVQQTEALIQQTFGSIPAGREGVSSLLSLNGRKNGQASGPLKQRHPVRPPVENRYGYGRLHPEEEPAPVQVYQHGLLQHFMLTIFCKLPVQPMSTVADMRQAFMKRILLSVLSFRVNRRYVEADPPFIGIELDISDSSREGCAVSTLTITSEPKDWRGAVQVAIQEVRRLQKYGVTASELERYTMALLRESQQAADQAASIPSAEMLDYTMESLGLDHVVMDPRETQNVLAEYVGTITVDEVNQEAATLLSFASFHGKEAEALEDAKQNPERYSPLGPTRATAIVACFPAFTDPSGESLGGGAPMQRGASMTTDKHVDPAMAPQVIEEASDIADDMADIPEGAARFELTAQEIEEAITEASSEVEAPAEVDVPQSLLPLEDVDRLVAERNPCFVPLAHAPEGSSSRPSPDPATGVVQRQLSNGIRINYWQTENEPQAAMIRVVASGGRAREGMGRGPRGTGAVSVGTRTLSESGTVGPWRRDQVELFCISRLLNCMLEADEEFVYMDCHFAVGDGGLQAMLELIHHFLEMPRWEEGAMERAKQMFTSHYRSLAKSLERATADRIMAAMYGADKRFRDPTPEEIEALTLDGMRSLVEGQLHTGNVEVNVVGAFDPQELEQLLVRYLGTVAPAANAQQAVEAPIQLVFPPLEQRQQTWHLKDSDERACAFIAGPAPPRWGNFQMEELPSRSEQQLVLPPIIPPVNATSAELQQAQIIRRAHPLYSDVSLRLLVDIMNSRLFTTIRDSLGLTYDVSFELTLFDRLRVGWFVIRVTSTPGKIRDALAACVDVLRSFHTQKVAHRELMRAKSTLLTRHESDYKDNGHRLGLITHLQRDDVPLKTIACLRDLPRMYEAATAEDIHDAYSRLLVDEEHLFTCIGTSGPNPLPEVVPAALQDDEAKHADAKAMLATLLAAVQATQQSGNVAKAMAQLREDKGRSEAGM